eukprot:CAMPEP_0117695420 /NCGR_PEP_ID=MMETSP0804-20121206/28131_1 /TAXON_ID=1074897 /ORGANISM="Tetraselmis astigmatica, Strain CCMP880" /LENGTH=377 /DNA_ID=CAMNT_0005509493 /DNA_START=289 /DNA_END=1423 /DNA_ORIENTATION=+
MPGIVRPRLCAAWSVAILAAVGALVLASGAAAQRVQKPNSYPIFWSGSGKTAPKKKAAKVQQQEQANQDIQLQSLMHVDPLEIDGDMAAQMHKRMFSVDPELNITVFSTKDVFTVWAHRRSQMGHKTSRPFKSAIFVEDMELPTLLLEEVAENATESQRRIALLKQQAKEFYQLKIAALQLSPYERTLYMDPDTCSCGSRGRLATLFNYLDEYDIAVAQQQGGTSGKGPRLAHVYAHSIPDKFMERYWGVILFKKTDAMMNLLDLIMELFVIAANQRLGHTSDQEAVREALYLSKGKIMEKTLSDNKDLCRLSTKKQKGSSCSSRPPSCSKSKSKCTLVQDMCECWSQARNLAVATKLSARSVAAPDEASVFPTLGI